MEAQRPDLIVFSGDVTGMSLEREFLLAARALGPLCSNPAVLGLPGNHDVYVSAERDAGFFRGREHEIDLLVFNTKDDDQLAMHGLAYPLAVEVRGIPILML